MLGLVTIGQAPRDDVTASMFGDARPMLIEAGALDGLDNETIESLRPTRGDHVLVTRLVDGREAVVGKERLLPYVQSAIDRVVDLGASIVCVLCTGAFPELRCPTLLIFPDRILSGVCDAFLTSGTLGVLMPHPDQHESMVAKWSTDGRTVVTASVSPYAGARAVGESMRQLVAAGAHAIVMDCMGFDRQMLADARRSVSTPVILANGLVGAILSELVGDPTSDQGRAVVS